MEMNNVEVVRLAADPIQKQHVMRQCVTAIGEPQRAIANRPQVRLRLRVTTRKQCNIVSLPH